ncbi:MAG: AAA family ATPase [Firmicutes bacterium]|nr:AAA family ATPase [Bacillota bacterium]
MRLGKILLEPFGAFSRLLCQFAPGLNVVVGPNEAGKTTLVNAIYAALFIPPSVKRNSQDWKNVIFPYLPYPDGDTARVTVELVDGKNEIWQLYCAWGAEKKACLCTPHGTEIVEEAAIQQKLSTLLRFGRGTYEKIFLARQDELVYTFERIKADQEALGTVTDMLRAVVLQGAGISLEKLAQKLEEKKKELESNWDLERDTPRGGRDIDNPHRRNVGKILAQYYAVRLLQQKLQETRMAEDNLAKAISQLQEVEKAYNLITEKEKLMGKLENEMQQRIALEPQLETCNLKLEQLKTVMQQWPQKAERLKNLEEKIKELEKRRENLTQELQQAEKELEIRKKRQIYKDAKALSDRLKEINTELNELPPVTNEVVEELEQQAKQLAGLKAEISGMKLKIKFYTKNELEVKIRSALAKENVRQVQGENIFSAQGLFGLETEDWSVIVQSGEKDVEVMLGQMEILTNELEKQLKNLGVTGVEEARYLKQKIAALKIKGEALCKQLEETLQGHAFPDLEAEIKQAGEEKLVRDLVEIKTDLLREEMQLKEMSTEREELQLQLKAWQDEYESLDNLLEAMVELKSAAKNIRETLEHLAPLPQEYKSAEAFLQELAKIRAEKEMLWQQLLHARENKIRAESNMPEESPEEIEQALQMAEKNLQALKAEAKALRVVAEEYYLLKEELDADTFSPLREQFVQNLAPLTGYRYKHVQMQGALPEGIALETGTTPLPLELLSCGTVSGVALALRLAMAQCLLQKEEGFMIMDDPLIDLDPERKKAAAEVLQEFAQTKQLIITTFDPQTARLLGGHQLNLGQVER